MPKSILDWKVRRNVSENPKTSKEALSEAGRSLIEADRLAEAADLLQKAADLDQLSRVRALAVEEGNLFLYQRACQAAGAGPAEAELEALSEKARAAGLSSYEARARELASEARKSS
ncbi:MAG: hypothetical protein LBE49_07055 [Deltaproteobacteria bacterium]|jgi:hypothetical protein|nr:hypothetical protein [Deltaproteobacteria bacterium]